MRDHSYGPGVMTRTNTALGDLGRSVEVAVFLDFRKHLKTDYCIAYARPIL